LPPALEQTAVEQPVHHRLDRRIRGAPRWRLGGTHVVDCSLVKLPHDAHHFGLKTAAQVMPGSAHPEDFTSEA
jgi:hypothetical protein